GILFQILLGVLQPEAHVGIGGEMEDGIASGHGRRQRGQIEVIAPEKFEVWMPGRVLQEFILAGGEVIPTHDGLAQAQKLVGESAADKTRGTRDEDSVQRY